ncbi:MAG TPA: MFS transporter [Acidimicrobiales bacterium]|nr:MFS transporter [Acidimicrobiales bacterium]
MGADASSPESTRVPRAGLALVTIALAQLMVMLDITIVNIALPTLQRSLGFSTSSLAWVIDAYVLTFGGFLLLGGRLGDLLRRRRMLMIGVGLFAVSSLAGGLASSPALLIAARVVQGLGAAIASPTALSLVVTTFPEGHARHRAMAVFAAMTAAGGATGLVLGGVLTDYASWRWVFFVNVPIGALLLALAPLALPRGVARRGRLDVPGALMITVAMSALVYGLVRGPEAGWGHPSTVAAFAVALVLLVAFVLVERRSAAPLVPLDFLAHHGRAVGYLVMVLIGGVMLAMIYFLTQFLQNVLGYSPVLAGVAYLPVPILVASTSQVVSRLVGRLGVKPFLVTGPLLVAGAQFTAATLHDGSSYLVVFVALCLMGIGMGLVFVPLMLNAVASVGHDRAGLAAGLLNTSQQIGGSLGLAVLVSVATTTLRDEAGPHVAGAAPLVNPVPAFANALHTAGAIALAAFLVAWTLPRLRRVDVGALEGLAALE